MLGKENPLNKKDKTLLSGASGITRSTKKEPEVTEPTGNFPAPAKPSQPAPITAQAQQATSTPAPTGNMSDEIKRKTQDIDAKLSGATAKPSGGFLSSLFKAPGAITSAISKAGTAVSEEIKAMPQTVEKASQTIEKAKPVMMEVGKEVAKQEKYIPKTLLKDILGQAKEKGMEPKEIFEGFVRKGYQVEGFNDEKYQEGAQQRIEEGAKSDEALAGVKQRFGQQMEDIKLPFGMTSEQYIAMKEKGKDATVGSEFERAFGGLAGVQETKGFVEDTATTAKENISDRRKTWNEETKKVIQEGKAKGENPLKTIFKGVVPTMGTFFGTLSDTLGAPIQEGGERVVQALPEEKKEYIKEKIGEFASTDAGKYIIDKAQEGGKERQEFSKDNPNVARNIEGVMNVGMGLLDIAGAGLAKKGVTKGVEGGIDLTRKAIGATVDTGKKLAPVVETTTKGLVRGATELPGLVTKGVETAKPVLGAVTKKVEGLLPKAPEAFSQTAKYTQKLDKGTTDLIDKALKPTVIGKTKDAKAIEKFHNDNVNSIRAIQENKGKLKLTDADGELIEGQTPENLKQYSEAITQTKNEIYSKYAPMAKKAGEKGATIKLDDIVSELDTLAKDPSIKASNPEMINYIESTKKAYQELGELSVEDAQKTLQQLNANLQAFYRNPNMNDIGKNTVQNMIANKMRKNVDDTIEMTLDTPEYRELKNKYASLRSIEQDVSKAAIRDARKNRAGLIDFTDIFSAGDVVAGIATANPALVGKGVAQNVVKNIFKSFNDPNKSIKKLFKQFEGMGPTAQELQGDLAFAKRQKERAGSAFVQGLQPKAPALPYKQGVNDAGKTLIPSGKTQVLLPGGGVKRPGQIAEINLTKKPLEPTKQLQIPETPKPEVQLTPKEKPVPKIGDTQSEVTVYRGLKEGGKKKFGFDAYTPDEGIAKTYGENVTKETIKPKKLADFSNPTDDILSIVKENRKGGKYYDMERLKSLATKEKFDLGTSMYEVFDDPNVIKALKERGYDYVKFNDFAGAGGKFKKHETYFSTDTMPKKPKQVLSPKQPKLTAKESKAMLEGEGAAKGKLADEIAPKKELGPVASTDIGKMEEFLAKDIKGSKVLTKLKKEVGLELKKAKAGKPYDSDVLEIYHGTNQPIKSIDEIKIGEGISKQGRQNFLGDGVYFTDDMPTAKDYARLQGGGAENVLKQNIKKSDFLDISGEKVPKDFEKDYLSWLEKNHPEVIGDFGGKEQLMNMSSEELGNNLSFASYADTLKEYALSKGKKGIIANNTISKGAKGKEYVLYREANKTSK